MSERNVTSFWHDQVRSSLARSSSAKVLEAKDLIEDAKLIEGDNTILVTNFGRVVAAILPEAESAGGSGDVGIEQVDAKNWDDPKQRAALVRKVAFEGQPLRVHDGVFRNIVPVDDSFQDDLIGSANFKTALLGADTPGSRST